LISFLFTTSSLPFSALTKWGLNTDCSHFAIGFDLDQPSGIIFHSDFMGCHIDFYSNFVKKNKVVHRLEFKDRLTLREEENVYQALISGAYKKGYDYGAYLFWAFNILGNKLFNLKISKKNLWQSKDYYLCTEVYSTLAGLEFSKNVSFPNVDNTSMLKPHDLYEELSCCKFLVDCAII